MAQALEDDINSELGVKAPTAEEKKALEEKAAAGGAQATQEVSGGFGGGLFGGGGGWGGDGWGGDDFFGDGSKADAAEATTATTSVKTVAAKKKSPRKNKEAVPETKTEKPKPVQEPSPVTNPGEKSMGGTDPGTEKVNHAKDVAKKQQAMLKKLTSERTALKSDNASLREEMRTLESLIESERDKYEADVAALKQSLHDGLKALEASETAAKEAQSRWEQERVELEAKGASSGESWHREQESEPLERMYTAKTGDNGADATLSLRITELEADLKACREEAAACMLKKDQEMDELKMALQESQKESAALKESPSNTETGQRDVIDALTQRITELEKDLQDCGEAEKCRLDERMQMEKQIAVLNEEKEALRRNMEAYTESPGPEEPSSMDERNEDAGRGIRITALFWRIDRDNNGFIDLDELASGVLIP